MNQQQKHSSQHKTHHNIICHLTSEKRTRHPTNLSAKFFHFLRKAGVRGVGMGSSSRLTKNFRTDCCSSSNGTRYIEEQSGTASTRSGETWQKLDIFLFTISSICVWLLQTIWERQMNLDRQNMCFSPDQVTVQGLGVVWHCSGLVWSCVPQYYQATTNETHNIAIEGFRMTHYESANQIHDHTHTL